MKQSEKIDLIIYPLYVQAYLLEEDNFSKIEKDYNFKIEESIKEDMSYSKGYCIKPEHNQIVIILFNNRIENNAELLKALRHEVNNAVNYVFDWIHAIEEEYKGLCYIYLNDFIFDKILNSLFKRISLT